jgi:glycosyltransferase involved in cell wall biosynthesis
LTAPAVSIVIPAYNEGASIRPILDVLFESVTTSCEVLVVFDTPEDTTAPILAEYAKQEPRLVPILNTYGKGPAPAIRFGLDAATAPVSVVSMADGSDDPADIDRLVELVEQGAAIGSASRYVRGGRQVGGPFIKKSISRLAGISLYWLARVGTRDATNSFKAYSTPFLRLVGIESTGGFEIGIELVAKARRLRLPVTEIPTTWQDRTEGESRFRMAAWIPKYLKWYFFAFGRKVDATYFSSRASEDLS